MLKEIAEFARSLTRDHRSLFVSDPNLRKRAGQFLTALLPQTQAKGKTRTAKRHNRYSVAQEIQAAMPQGKVRPTLGADLCPGDLRL
jgi:hypothetical protein